MAWQSFQVTSVVKVIALILLFEIVSTASGQDGAAADGQLIVNPLGGGAPPSGGGSSVFDDWVNQEVQNYEFSAMKDSTTVVLDPKLSDAEAKKKLITVGKSGGDFKTITDAIKSIPDGNTGRVIIKILPGTYNEKILIDAKKPFITFYGSQKNMPTIVYDGTAKKYGTFYSATVCVMSDYFMAVNIIFKNSAPMPAPGSEGGQAVALRIAGDKAAFYNCHFLGFQDTLHDDMGRHYYKNCLIQGTVDFIFGDARSLYTATNIVCVAAPKGFTAIIAQGRTDSSDKGGFSFVNCKVTGTGKAHLSRAWRSYSRVVFANSFLDKLVDPTGWDSHGLSESHLYYGEYQCTGPGASMENRVSYCTKLTATKAKPFLDSAFVEGRSWILPIPTV